MLLEQYFSDIVKNYRKLLLKKRKKLWWSRDCSIMEFFNKFTAPSYDRFLIEKHTHQADNTYLQRNEQFCSSCIYLWCLFCTIERNGFYFVQVQESDSGDYVCQIDVYGDPISIKHTLNVIGKYPEIKELK